MASLETYQKYCARVAKLSPESTENTRKAHRVMIELGRSMRLKNRLTHDDWERSMLMKNIDCIVVYYKVEDKLVPEIFEDAEDLRKFEEYLRSMEKVEEK
jgi:hypothetical protein